MASVGAYKVAIRADGGRGIGLGHVMRTIPIAEALHDRGCEVVYLSASDLTGSVVERYGFSCERLDCEIGDVNAEVQLMCDLVHKEGLDFVFIDSFYANNDYFKALSRVCPVGTFGYGDRFSEGLSLIVSYLACTDYGWYEREFAHRSISVLVGSSYVPVRREFTALREHNLHKAAKGILLSVGGSDEFDVTGALLDKLVNSPLVQDNDIHVVIGAAFSCGQSLREAYGSNPHIVLHENVERMSEVFASCDIAITAAGYTVFELAVSRIPMVAFAVSDDQALNGEVPGVMRWMGDIRTEDRTSLDPRALASVIQCASELACSGDLRLAMIRASEEYEIDGLGGTRIADEIVSIAGRGKGRWPIVLHEN